MSLLTISNTSNLEAARVGFHAAFLEQLGMVPNNPLSQLFVEVSSSTGIEEWNWLGDLPDFEEWKGDRFLADLRGYKLRVVNKDWASGIRVHQNEIKDDKMGLVQPKIAGLATKAQSHKTRLMMKLLINGFAGTAYPDVGNGLAYDGAFFFSTSRGTGSNKGTTALTANLAGAAAFNAAVLLMQSQTNFDGTEAIEVNPTHLIVGPKLLPAATMLMTADTIEGDDNPVVARPQVIVSPLLRGTYDDYWFLVDLSQPIKPFLFQNREDISTSAVVGEQGGSGDSVPRFQRGELWFGAEARYNVAYLEPRTIFGSIL